MGSNLDTKYIVYLTTNIVNGYIYIGVHKTETPNKFDNYLGCGVWINEPYTYLEGTTLFQHAVAVYGPKSFKRRTLKVFDTVKEALALEKELVNKDFISRVDTYNMVLGGKYASYARPIYQFDIKGNLIKRWESETEARQYYDCKVQFSDIIKTKRSFAGSFWNFENSINITEYKTECNRGFIAWYNEEGILLQVFKNTTIAAQQLDLDRQAITRAVFKKKKYAGGYFVKADVDIAEVLSSKYKPMLGKTLIYRYLEDGTFDAEFSSITEATRETKGLTRGQIPYALINGKKCGGYLWSYYKEQSYFDIVEPNKKPEIKIAQYDKDGNLIKIWDSPKECKKEFPYALQVCQGKAKSTKNYVFKYIQD